MIQYRFAKSSDAKLLTKVHLICAKHQKGGFFHNLGFYFTFTYYKILLSNKNSIILIAEDQNQNCLGFHSGTLKMEEQLIQLRKNRLILAVSLIPVLIKTPILFFDVMKRYLSISNIDSEKNDFGVKKGARGEYWCWLPSNSDPLEALKLLNKWFNIMKELGADSVCIEADTVNERILKFHLKNGATMTNELNLPDGRKRVILKYNLN
tara:strand:+ start:287 stop:910 length:624 start_codon:yes stop_codon:yes gene_type:complete